MMNQKERAKQFQPFDAMKGLTEALKDREERHARKSKTAFDEEYREENMSVISKLEKGMQVSIDCYYAFHDISVEGTITEINTAYKYLKLNNDKICFDDIYAIRILDYVE